MPYAPSGSNRNRYHIIMRRWKRERLHRYVVYLSVLQRVSWYLTQKVHSRHQRERLKSPPSKKKVSNMSTAMESRKKEYPKREKEEERTGAQTV
jgi:hypothetical protein